MTRQPESESEIPRSVWFFLTLAFGISWGAYGLRQLGTWPASIDESLRLLVKFGPSLAGVIAAYKFGHGAAVTNLLTRVVRVSIPIRWYAVALLLPIALVLLAMPIRAVFGTIQPIQFAGLQTLSLFGVTLAVRFFAGGGLGEELGWRGFMLPLLQDRVGAYRASLMIGLFHGAWHFPAYGPAVILLTLYTVAGSFVFTWLYNRTNGSILIPALMHASGNASLPWIESIVPAIDGEILYPLIVFGCWMIFALLLVQKATITR